jgi:hypothetical protein
MKRFDAIANKVFLTLLEADGVSPGAAPGADQAQAPAAGLPQDGGPVNAPTPTPEPQKTPQEMRNWQTDILNTARVALLTVKNDPGQLSEDDVKTLSSTVTIQNKDQTGGVQDIMNRLAGNT